MNAGAVETMNRRLRDAVERLPAGLRDHVFRVEEESARHKRKAEGNDD